MLPQYNLSHLGCFLHRSSSPAMVVQMFHCLLHALCCPRRSDSDAYVRFHLSSSSAHNLMEWWDSQRC